MIPSDRILATLLPPPEIGMVFSDFKMYAYDAYFLDCALRHASPLLTLDKPLMCAAKKLNIHVLEIKYGCV